MSESEMTLADCVSHITLDGREIYLVGTAHVSKQSVEDVRNTVDAVRPDTICVELCEPRYKAMTQGDSWKTMNIFRVIRDGKSVFLLAQLVLSSFYRRLGEKLGIQPGAEMLEGIVQAEKTGAQLVLADRKIDVTLKRVWGYLGFWNKMKLFVQLLGGIFESEQIDEELVEKMKKSDQLELVMAEFAGRFPEIKRRLLDERDIYLAQKIRRAPGKKIAAIVGAGHVPGILENIKQEQDIEPLMEIPAKSKTGAILKWAIPALIVALLAWGFYKGGSKQLIDSIYIWIFVNGILSAIGAAIAMGHPLAIASAFLAAPLTSLNPFMAAGWVAGLVQAWVRKPTVADFEKLTEIKTTKQFWLNPVTRVLLVCALANLGSVIGTFLAGFLIARLGS